LAEIAGQGWLEGDVSTSAARRLLLPQLFSNVSAILINWRDAADRWEPNCKRLSQELELYAQEVSTGALLHYLVESGMSRSEAHEKLRGGVLEVLAEADDDRHEQLVEVMVEAGRIPALALTEVDLIAEATGTLAPSS
jgi:adenylosuccinate lyase